jgi:hypothetical protein
MDQDKNFILQSGVSDELNGLLNGIREIKDVYGRQKYPATFCDKLNQGILCRNFHDDILQLSHLLIAVSLLPEHTFNSFFWVEEIIKKDAVSEAFTPPMNDYGISVRLVEGFITLDYPDDQRFRISVKKVWYLALWMEFLSHFLTPDDIELLALTLIAKSAAKQALSEYLNQMNKAVTHFLDQHLKPITDHRKFHYILKYFEQDSAELNDQTILNFWQDNAFSPEVDFLMYSTVGESFCKFQTALDIGAVQFDLAQSYSSEDIVNDMPSTTEDHLSLLKITPLEDVKFLNDSEIAQIKILDQAGRNRSRFPLTMVRMATFGLYQNKFTQAKRSKKSAANFQKLIADVDFLKGYEGYYTGLEKTLSRTEKSLLGSLHILFSCQKPEALGFLQHHIPDATGKILQNLTNVDGWAEAVPLYPAEAQILQSDFREKISPRASEGMDEQQLTAVAFYQKLPQLRQEIVALNDLLITAGKAFKDNNRQGYKETTTAPPDVIEAHITAKSLLMNIQRMIKEHQNQINPLRHQKYPSDQSIFKGMFDKIYGDIK